MVRDFEREPSGDLWLVVDLDTGVQAGAESESTQEYAITLAASLATIQLAEGERRGVGLALSGRKPAFLSPARGGAHLSAILSALATAESAPGTPLDALLGNLALLLRGGGRTLVAITPSLDPAWLGAALRLQARGEALAAVLVDPSTFTPARGSPAELQGLRARLAAQGVTHYVIAQGFPFRPRERLRRRRRELRTLSGHGRVVLMDVEEEV
jgi:uncharacterized protein (DUF58 family)